MLVFLQKPGVKCRGVAGAGVRKYNNHLSEGVGKATSPQAERLLQVVTQALKFDYKELLQHFHESSVQ